MSLLFLSMTMPQKSQFARTNTPAVSRTKSSWKSIHSSENTLQAKAEPHLFGGNQNFHLQFSLSNLTNSNQTSLVQTPRKPKGIGDQDRTWKPRSFLPLRLYLRNYRQNTKKKIKKIVLFAKRKWNKAKPSAVLDCVNTTFMNSAL